MFCLPQAVFPRFLPTAAFADILGCDLKRKPSLGVCGPRRTLATLGHDEVLGPGDRFTFQRSREGRGGE
jgi:hypothetical protein